MAKEEVWTAEKVEKILVLAQDVISLNTPIRSGDDDDETDLSYYVEDPAPNPEELLLHAGRKEELIAFMNKYLRPREVRVLLLRYGFETERPMSLQEVGDVFGVTRERVRQIEFKALRKLRYACIRNEITTAEDF